MKMRRDFLAGVAGALLAAETVAGQNLENAKGARKDRSSSDVGPENSAARDSNPNTFSPPETDHGEVQTFWNSFATSHRRIQEGGWSRQITRQDFPISKDLAGVNMRLTAGGVRELHWHAAAEWSIMLNGSARITAIDGQGRSYVKDVGVNDLWYFPEGTPHSIQGLGPDGCEFLLVFDDSDFSEADTTLISDWVRHTPPEVLAKNWGVAESEITPVYSVPQDGRYIFQTKLPEPLETERKIAAGSKAPSPIAFDFSLGAMKPTFETASGSVRIVDARNFSVSQTIAAAQVIVKPGGMRELHWHQNAEEWQFYISGQGRMTVFFNGGKARTADFHAGDVGVVPKTFGHYIENTGSTDLVFLEMFKADRYKDLSLSEWIRHTPPQLVMQHLNISRETLDKIPREKTPVIPA